MQIALHHFFANDVRADLQGQYARVWQAVARHYRGNPDVLGYEIYNEPNDYLVRQFDPELQCDYGGPVKEPKSCAVNHPQALPDGLIGAIQAADPTHVVFYEPSGSANFGTPETIGIAEPLRFPRLALAFHTYGDTPAELAQTAAERARTHTAQPGGPAWILDEFGANNNDAGSAADGGPRRDREPVVGLLVGDAAARPHRRPGLRGAAGPDHAPALSQSGPGDVGPVRVGHGGDARAPSPSTGQRRPIAIATR